MTDDKDIPVTILPTMSVQAFSDLVTGKANQTRSEEKEKMGQTNQSPSGDRAVQYLKAAIATFTRDQALSDFQRGYLRALEEALTSIAGYEALYS